MRIFCLRRRPFLQWKMTIVELLLNLISAVEETELKGRVQKVECRVRTRNVVIVDSKSCAAVHEKNLR